MLSHPPGARRCRSLLVLSADDAVTVRGQVQLVLLTGCRKEATSCSDRQAVEESRVRDVLLFVAVWLLLLLVVVVLALNACNTQNTCLSSSQSQK